jgi:hypothetical protein
MYCSLKNILHRDNGASFIPSFTSGPLADHDRATVFIPIGRLALKAIMALGFINLPLVVDCTNAAVIAAGVTY